MKVLEFSKGFYMLVDGDKFVRVRADEKISKELVKFISKSIKGTEIKIVVVHYNLYSQTPSDIKDPIKWQKNHEGKHLHINLRKLLVKFLNENPSYVKKNIIDLLKEFNKYFKDQVWKFIHDEPYPGETPTYLVNNVFPTSNLGNCDVIDRLIFAVMIEKKVDNKFPEIINSLRETVLTDWWSIYSVNSKMVEYRSDFKSSNYFMKYLFTLLRFSNNHYIDRIEFLDNNMQIENGDPEEPLVYVSSKTDSNLVTLVLNVGFMFKKLIEDKPDLIKVSFEDKCSVLRRFFYKELKDSLFGKESKFDMAYSNLVFNEDDPSVALMMDVVISAREEK